uniref:Putative conserved plasma membrane protein n=1 Tax=Rhipicephalus microplus TaxID=6941 RepID=A0A6G5AIP2_RHIMP
MWSYFCWLFSIASAMVSLACLVHLHDSHSLVSSNERSDWLVPRGVCDFRTRGWRAAPRETLCLVIFAAGTVATKPRWNSGGRSGLVVLSHCSLLSLVIWGLCCIIHFASDVSILCTSLYHTDLVNVCVWIL